MNMKKKSWVTLPLIALLSMSTLLAACGNNSNSASPTTDGNTASTTTGKKLHIVTSFYPMQEFTSKVAGDLADVQVLVPAGTEPHDWEPTAQDIAKMTDADMLVYNGGGVESWIDQVKDTLGDSGPKLVEASQGIQMMESTEEEHEGEEAGHAEEADHATEEGHDHGSLDPHVWLSPLQAQTEVRNIETALTTLDPDHTADYKKNADAYIAELQKLDAEYKASLSKVKRKDFITQHAAFAYLAHDYGLTQVPIAGLSPEQEPSAEAMAKIVDFAKQNDVKTIFFETLVSSNVAKTIADEIGAKTDVLNPLEGLTSAETSAGENYVSVMRTNLAALEKALNE
ncbi:metal ABC transporter substrate-binding protein [Paenibacillus sp. PK4536]|uniref:Metal ABC transporter substrate-binding lipoprotein n=1 Tax=Paenibacillus nuruki TaxID=1886670 RepID=A0A1E3L902_9BACL|nr:MULTISPECIES: metal ABC transporter substrate-binding protein [Paenibacillus]ODP30183.1 Metal ABC transporter substrate-binding lipoprotein [Paenibacillus nuruki]TKJ91689.1 AdcA domain-containing protein [Paenibacillus sp. CFBP13512]WIM37925.1 metal ABC transporter substrate-binding protein [Paenibacillus sp. PK4536]CAJ1315414.1 Metal ABC transporter substrate-binding lipoprotein [Paenibacillus nuruki]